MFDPGPTDPRTLPPTDRRELVRRLASAGWSYRRIADAVGVSHTQAAKDIRHQPRPSLNSLQARMVSEIAAKIRLSAEEWGKALGVEGSTIRNHTKFLREQKLIGDRDDGEPGYQITVSGLAFVGKSDDF